MAIEHFNYVYLEGQVCRIVSVGELYAAYVDCADYELVSKYRWFYNEGYACTQIVGDDGRRRRLSMHILIMGKRAGLEIDHINHNPRDNRRINLRFCTHAENMANRRSFTKNKTSRYKGVRWLAKRRRWVAEICVEQETIVAGFFRTEEEAAQAYDDAAVTLRPTFSLINFPREADEIHRARHQKRKAIRTARAWTKDATEFLVQNYGRLTVVDIASQLGRTANAVKSMAYSLGLKPHRRRHFNNPDQKTIDEEIEDGQD